jgi:hypothetical protein
MAPERNIFADYDPPPRVRYRSDGRGGVLLDAPFPITLTLRQAQARLEHFDGRREAIAADPATAWRTHWFDNIISSLLSATADAERCTPSRQSGDPT